MLGNNGFRGPRQDVGLRHGIAIGFEELDDFQQIIEIRFHVRARSFLHNQVRILTGTLVQVGLGRWFARDVAAALDARDRRAAGPTAPPHGLCLTEVRYDRDG